MKHLAITNLDAEAVVLSACLLKPEKFAEVMPLLTAEAFYSDANRWIWKSLNALSDGGKPIDAVTVAHWLKEQSRLEEIGGTPYLAQILDSTPSIENVVEHAQIVQTAWRQRQAIALAQTAVAELRDGTPRSASELQTILETFERQFGHIAHFATQSPMRSLKEAMADAYQQIEAARARGTQLLGATTGFRALDRMLTGMKPADVYVVAGRPGMGKTAFVLALLLNAARGGDPGALFSLEMPYDQIALRVLAAEAGVTFNLLRTPLSLQYQHLTKLADAMAALGPVPVYIDDTAAIPVAQIRGRLRKLNAERAAAGEARIRVVAVDYLQLVKPAGSGNNREQDVAGICRDLKQLAKEEEVAVIALSQLNRSAEEKPGQRPELKHLRESGAIEQDADVVIFLYRPEYYLRGEPDPALEGFVEAIVAKQRNGPVGTRKLAFRKESMRFDNLADDEWDEYDPTTSRYD